MNNENAFAANISEGIFTEMKIYLAFFVYL